MLQNQQYEELRKRMVLDQLVRRGIHDEKVLRAMGRVPRHVFLENLWADRAYEDHAISIGEGQTISQPYIVAVMTQALDLKGGDRVLEVGTGSGYQAAVLAEMGARVWTIERVPSLARRAERILWELGYRNVTTRAGDGTLGWPEEAPFTGIIVTAGSPAIPERLANQLEPGGRMVIPIGDRDYQDLVRVTKTGEGLSTETLLPCVFVPLIGEFGWHGDSNP
jgi:protein-L-isoaspartate(D-aspartate) O-methyltransferase